MNSRTAPRPGGRSARVQAAIHRATRELLESHGRAELTVPMIATRSGVTPSTIYRRWGNLADLLADVAVARMRPDSDPADTGTAQGDLQAWAEQFLEEMSSEVGLAMMRDVLSASSGGDMPVPCQCAEFTAAQIAVIVARGVARQEAVPSVDAVMDGVVAPIIYRLLFAPQPPTHQRVRAWVDACMKSAPAPA
ncbi:MAG: TetR/AcrR family transcriptional regulator [Rubrivivax sp.]|nr:MAG: TetR/AcrR family transcriptional regulator [Rubrivivax sp.]